MHNENPSNAYWKVMEYYLMNAKIFDLIINFRDTSIVLKQLYMIQENLF